jgi:galactokinase
MSGLESLVAEFHRRQGGAPELVARAPGRVNLIGEHTDYNDGFVLPIAIDLDIWIAARPRDDRRVCITALDIPDHSTDEFSLDDIEHHPDLRWANYIRGVAFYLEQAGASLRGMDALIASDIPPGAGLSSSAALEVCAATALLALGGSTLDKVTLARLCQRAENDFVGVKSGIMDQYASALGEEGKALLIDCRALTYTAVTLPLDVTVVVADTMKKRDLASSEYNTRRAECENAAVLLGQLLKRKVPALRDVSVREFRRLEKHLPPNLARRARHVITENERVQKAVRAAKKNDAVRFGQLMDESQQSLQVDYGASSRELDAMVESARRLPGCLGSRLTGAGWGGATVNLVRDSDVAPFVESLERAYRARTGIAAWITPVRASAGAGVLTGEEISMTGRIR